MGRVCLHALGYLGDEESSDFTLCHWTSSPFLETSVSPVSHTLQALQGRDAPVFTDEVSTGPNSNVETRIKESSAYCSQQELSYLQSSFSTICCVLPYWGFLGHFTEVSGRLALWGQVSCKGQQKVQQQQGLWLLKSRAGKLSPLSCEPPKAKLRWHWAKSSHAGWGARGSGDIRGQGLPKPAGHFRALLCSDLGSLQLHCLKTKKRTNKNKPFSLKGEREILKFKGNFSCDL